MIVDFAGLLCKNRVCMRAHAMRYIWCICAPLTNSGFQNSLSYQADDVMKFDNILLKCFDDLVTFSELICGVLGIDWDALTTLCCYCVCKGFHLQGLRCM